MSGGARALALAFVLVACARGTGNVDSGVQGTVLLGPQCPVVIEGSPCPDLPTAAEVRASDIATTRSGDDGRFRLPLPPGRFTLVAESLIQNGGLPAGKPLDVEVRAHAFSEVTLLLDTGLR